MTSIKYKIQNLRPNNPDKILPLHVKELNCASLLRPPPHQIIERNILKRSQQPRFAHLGHQGCALVAVFVDFEIGKVDCHVPVYIEVSRQKSQGILAGLAVKGEDCWVLGSAVGGGIDGELRGKYWNDGSLLLEEVYEPCLCLCLEFGWGVRPDNMEDSGAWQRKSEYFCAKLEGEVGEDCHDMDVSFLKLI